MPKLGQLLVQRGWASPEDVQAALTTQAVAGGRLGTCLLESNALTEDLLLKALSELHRLPAVGVEDLRDLPAETVAVLPARVAIRCRAVPFRAFGTQVHVAMLDPRDLNCQDELAFAAGKRIQPYVANEVRLRQALDRYYGDECPSRLATLAERLDRARYLWRTEEQQERPAAAAAGRGETSARSVWEHPETALFGSRPPQPTAAPRPAGPEARSAAPATPAATPAPRRPAPSPRPMVVPLTESERAEIARREGASESTGDDTRPVPADAPPLPLTFPEAVERLERASEPEEIGRFLVAFLGRRFERVALFRVHRDRVAGWRGAGSSLDEDCLRAFEGDFSQPSVFLNLRQGGTFFLGPLPSMALHKALARCWGGSLPRECLILPVRLRGRLVTAIYLDREPERLGQLDLEPLLGLATATAGAFERCIYRKKKD